MPLLKKPFLGRLSVVTALAVAASTVVLSPASGREPTPTERATAAVGWPPAAPTQLVIDTAGAVIDREDYVAGTVTLDGVTRVTEVRGRGNSTWGWAKKPYKLKLEDDAALVGSREYDEWVLLAGYGDRSALRTAAAFAVAAQTRLGWTPRFRFVEVVLNGASQGLYMLTEQVEQGKGRVDLPDDGYLLEFNKRYLRDGEPGFRTKRGSSIAFKDPDEITKKQRRQVRGAVTRFEKVLYGPGLRRPEDRLCRLRRREADHRLVPRRGAVRQPGLQLPVERALQLGAREAVHVRPGLGLRPQRRHQLAARRARRRAGRPAPGKHWISRMLEDPAFSRRVKSRWARLRPAADAVVSQLRVASATIEPLAEADWRQWHADGTDLEWTRHARPATVRSPSSRTGSPSACAG